MSTLVGLVAGGNVQMLNLEKKSIKLGPDACLAAYRKTQRKTAQGEF